MGFVTVDDDLAAMLYGLRSLPLSRDEAGLVAEEALLELADVVTLLDELSALCCLDELTEEMHRSLDDLVLLGQDLHLEDDLVQEGLELPLSSRASICVHPSSAAIVAVLGMEASSEGEVDAVPDDLEVWSLELVLPLRTRRADVGLFAHVGLGPVWLIAHENSTR